jgi:O-antigen/teichoic acid export membrane protein
MFVVPLVNVRTLSVEEYGYYRQFWLIFETLTPIVMLGFSRSLLYYLPRAQGREEQSAYLTQTVLFLTVGAIAAIFLYAVMAQTLGAGLGAAARSFYWRLSFFTLFMVVTDYMEVLFVAQRRPIAQSVYHATVWGVQGIVVIAASYLSHDVSTIIWALAFYGMGRFLFSIAYTHLRFEFTLRHVSIRSIREQASFAVPVGLAGIGVILVSQTDKFIINRFMGREAFAVYSVGAFQLPLGGIILTSVGNVTFPLLAQYHKSGNYPAMLELWRRALIKTVALILPMFVFLEVTARPFITVLFTEQYSDATPIFMIYTLIFLRSSVESGAIIQAFNRTSFLVKSFLVGVVLNVALGLLLFHWMGRIGVPLATLITFVGITIACLWYSAKLVGVSLLELLPIRQLAAYFLVAAIPGAALWLLYHAHPVTDIYELAAAGTIYSLIYVPLCVWARLVTIADLRALVGRKSI